MSQATSQGPRRGSQAWLERRRGELLGRIRQLIHELQSHSKSRINREGQSHALSELREYATRRFGLSMDVSGDSSNLQKPDRRQATPIGAHDIPSAESSSTEEPPVAKATEEPAPILRHVERESGWDADKAPQPRQTKYSRRQVLGIALFPALLFGGGLGAWAVYSFGPSQQAAPPTPQEESSPSTTAMPRVSATPTRASSRTISKHPTPHPDSWISSDVQGWVDAEGRSRYPTGFAARWDDPRTRLVDLPNGDLEVRVLAQATNDPGDSLNLLINATLARTEGLPKFEKFEVVLLK